MISNFFSTGIRNIKKNKLVSFLNIAGLSMGIACTLVILIFIKFTKQVDHFHRDKERVSLITYKPDNNDGNKTWGTTPAALGPALQQNFPHVEQMVRLNREQASVRVGNKDAFFEQVTFSDPGFFSIFHFPLKWGNPASLQSPKHVIISERTAEKYFGDQNPVGTVLKVQLSNGRSMDLVIGGVAAAFPKKRSFDFSLLVNYQVLKELYPAYDGWEAFTDATFIKTVHTGDIQKIIAMTGPYLQRYNAANPGYRISSFGYAPFETLSLNSYRIYRGFVRGWGPPAGRTALLLIGFMLITISCLNYINAAIGLGSRRLMEIGVRKVFGGTRLHIIYQFMMENLLINLFSLLLGVLITWLFLLPQFERILDIGLRFDPLDPLIWVFLLVITVLTTLFSGAYPSFYIARYHTVYILKGNKTFGSRNLLSKFALTLQFILAFVYIVSSLLFIANDHYLRNRDWGYDAGHLITITPAGTSAYDYFLDQLRSLPEVKAVSGAREHIGFSSSTAEVKLNDNENAIKTILLGVDSSYIRTLNVDIAAGTPFDRSINSGINTVVINEAMARSLNLKTVIGIPLRIDSQTHYISAVSKNFRFNDFQLPPEPVVIMQVPPEQCTRLVIRTTATGTEKVFERLKDMWRTISPEAPFAGAYQDQAFESYFNLLSGHNKIMVFSAVLALIISCIGLFNLVYLNITNKQKDYSIMKVLGAGTFSLVRKVWSIYAKGLIIAVIIGIPSSLFLTKMMFGIVYREHVPISWVYALGGVFLLVPIYMLTVLSLVLRIVRHDPVKSLRNE